MEILRDLVDFIKFKFHRGYQVEIPIQSCFDINRAIHCRVFLGRQVHFIQLHRDTMDWLQDTCQNGWTMGENFDGKNGLFMHREVRDNDVAKFRFQKRQDALLFKLTWS